MKQYFKSVALFSLQILNLLILISMIIAPLFIGWQVKEQHQPYYLITLIVLVPFIIAAQKPLDKLFNN